MLCPHCQHDNPDSAKFCRNCGKAMDGGTNRSHFGLIVGVIALIVTVLAVLFFFTAAPSAVNKLPVAPSIDAIPAAKVSFGLAYGTEKEAWLTWAVGEFAKTPVGANVQINLKPMGSLEAANAIVKDDPSIQVWSPASTLYKDAFVRDFTARHGMIDPFVSETPLVSSPMVLVMWQERYDAFRMSYPDLNFRNIGKAIYEKGGWATIAQKPEWMFFKFSHTNPNQSNSGLAALMLMAYDYHDKPNGLDGTDITDPKFQTWLLTVERNLIGAASGLVNSTGNLMTSMLQRGPSTYDCVLVYESNAIERLKQADARWGALRIIYPHYNFMNEHPYFVLNVASSSPEQRRAAQAFATFLLSRDVQAKAMADGFRPANSSVSIKDPDSPWELYSASGLMANPTGVFCESPNADVIQNLLLCWQRSQAGK